MAVQPGGRSAAGDGFLIMLLMFHSIRGNRKEWKRKQKTGVFFSYYINGIGGRAGNVS
jgi:hypothetical protein